jgi:hypothetical protein
MTALCAFCVRVNYTATPRLDCLPLAMKRDPMADDKVKVVEFAPI